MQGFIWGNPMSRKNEVAGPSRNAAQLWMHLVVKVKSSAVQNNAWI